MSCRLGIATMSLGRCYAGHSLKHRLSMAAKHGIEGIELFYEDLVDHSGSDSPSDLLAGAASVRDLCSSLDLTIICLQPFWHYDGLLDRQKHEERIQEMKLWMRLAKILQTDIIQVPATFLPPYQTSSDTKLIVSDLQEIADLGLQQSPIIRIAYESLCWSTHVNRWEACWDIILQVDRSNFGICLDTFHILGTLYGDPASATGKIPDAEERLRDSLKRLVDQIKPHREKIFFVQIADGERLDRPLIPGHEFYNADQPTLMSWSRNCRLFYGETAQGAYMPVIDVAHAIINEIGYTGWVSMELYNRVLNSRDEAVVEELAERAVKSWRRLQYDLETFEGMQRGLLKSASVQNRVDLDVTNSIQGANFSRL